MISEYSGFFGGKNTFVNKLKGPFVDKDLSLSDVLLTKRKRVTSAISGLLDNSETETESTD